MKYHIIRLKTGKDLKQELQKFVDEKTIQAAFIATCVGGLEKAVLRMAGATPSQQDVKEYIGKYEIVSLVGTVSKNGSHLHVSLSDKEGATIGGHLKDGSLVAYTAEIVIGELEGKIFKRFPDENTGFNELVAEDVT